MNLSINTSQAKMAASAILSALPIRSFFYSIMSEAGVYLAKGAPLRRRNSEAERRKGTESMRMMSEKDGEEQ